MVNEGRIMLFLLNLLVSNLPKCHLGDNIVNNHLGDNIVNKHKHTNFILPINISL